jgi:methyl-accepting chemotaxis protein
MDKITQSNAAAAEESASAAEELNAQAGMLTSVVGDLIALVGGSSATETTQAETRATETGGAVRTRAPVTAKKKGAMMAPVLTNRAESVVRTAEQDVALHFR